MDNRIESNQAIMFGKPCFKGTRIPVELVAEKLKNGESKERLLKSYPRLTLEDIEFAGNYKP